MDITHRSAGRAGRRSIAWFACSTVWEISTIGNAHSGEGPGVRPTVDFPCRTRRLRGPAGTLTWCGSLRTMPGLARSPSWPFPG